MKIIIELDCGTQAFYDRDFGHFMPKYEIPEILRRLAEAVSRQDGAEIPAYDRDGNKVGSLKYIST